MIQRTRIFPILAGLCLLLGATGSHAQLQVSIKLVKSDLVAHEPVEATVSITNQAGRDILLHSSGNPRSPVTWLDFSIRSGRSANLSPVRRFQFDATRIPAGRTVARTIDLGRFYRLADPGTYNVHAVVRLPNGGGTFRSNGTTFRVSTARVIYSTRIGVPGTTNVREYKLMSFRRQGNNSLYIGVSEPSTGRTLQTYSIGPALTFHKPQAVLDGQNNLHVLYLSAPEVFTHVRVGPNGAFLGREYFKRGASGTPTLRPVGNGQIAIASAVSYNPEQERRNKARIRRISERPNIVYQ